MILQTELDDFRASWETRVGDAIARLFAGDIADLRSTGICDRAVRVGQRLPAVPNLVAPSGQAFDLGRLIAQKPVIITFYRGGWCPYCNLELRAYLAILADIHAAGGALVAVSPELPDHSLSTAESNDLSFTVLSDEGSAFAAALGIRFTLSDTLRPFYEKAGHALPERNGDGGWTMPIPATIVVEQGGRIAATFIEPDYRKRLDPKGALLALQAIDLARAA